MSLQQRIADDLTAAMKARDKGRTAALRMVKTAVKNEEIEAGSMDDARAVKVLVRLVKQRNESIEQFEQGGRRDLADQERRELAILEEYLPSAPSAEEMEATVSALLAELGASSMKDMGRVMKEANARFAGRPVDGKRLSEVVRGKLSG